MPNPNLRVELSADPTKLERGFKSAEAAARVIERELRKVEAAERSLGQLQLQASREMQATFAARERAARDMARTQVAAEREMLQAFAARRQVQADLIADAGKLSLAFGGALAAGLIVSGRAAMRWESAWAGVQKVVDGNTEQLGALESQLRGLATTMPATAEEIAGVAEAAGQLGVARADIADFTATAVRLGVSTNLSAEEAATGLAQLGNVMGVLPDQADRAGAALVALGNDGASTEQDILQMALRIGAAGRLVGMSEADVLGYANALSSMGIEAEAGGTAISRVFLTIEDAVRNGGGKLALFASVAGRSAQDFKRAFAEDAGRATALFTAGLDRIQQSGGNAAAVLGRLGLDEIRVRDTLLRTAGASQLLTKSLDTGNEAWQQNIALVAESSRRFETAESRIKVAQNRLNDAAIDVGANVLPTFAALADDVGTLGQLFSDLPAPVKAAAVTVGAVAAGVTILGGAAAVAVPRVVALNAALDEMGPRGQRIASGLSGIGSALTGPVGIGITAGLTVATVALGKWTQGQIKARQQVEALTAAIREDNGAIGENTALAVYEALKDNGVADLARRLGVDINDVTQAAIGNADAMFKVNEQLDAYYRALEQAGGNTVVASQDVEQLRSSIDSQTGKVRDNQQAWQEQQDVLAGANRQMQGNDSAARDAARAQAILSASADDTTETIKALKTALSNLNDTTLDAREAEIGWQEAIANVAKAAKENGGSLNVSTEAGRSNEQAMIAAARAAQDRANTILGTTGSEAEWRKSLVQSRGKLEELAGKFIKNKDKAKEYADQLLKIPPVVPTEIRLTGIQGAISKVQSLSQSIRDIPSLQAGIYSGMAGNKLPTQRAAGGLIPGPPSTADNVPLLASTGEYVINAAAVSHYGPAMFDALNARRLAAGGPVGRYASGGMVTMTSSAVTGPLLSAYQSSLGSPVTWDDRAEAVRKRRDATDALRIAEAKLRAVQKDRKHTTVELAEAELRARKTRDALAAATANLTALDRRAAAQRQAPLSQLSAALGKGIRDGGAFVRNIETLSARGFGELARQLAEQGDADAERIAADAVRAKPAQVKALQDQAITAGRIGAQRAQLGDIARVIDAMRARPNGSLDDLAGALGMDVPEVVALLRLVGGGLAGMPGGRHYGSLIPRAGGGRVDPRTAYLVGEHRAEVFVPDQPGRIIPHVSMTRTAAAGTGSGGTGDTYVIHAPTTAADELVERAQAASRRTRAVRGRR